MATQRHTHKYIRRNISNNPDKPTEVYCCAFSDCTHYMPSNGLVVGKKTICWKCEGEFALTAEAVMERKTIKPKCPSCRRRVVPEKEDVRLDAAIDLLSQFKLP